MQETGYGRDKIAKSLQGLKNKSVITFFQKKTDGKFAKTFYKITTKQAGVFINAEDEVLYDNPRTTENRTTENPSTENPQLSINHTLSINKSKEKIDFSKLLIFINKTTGRGFKVINKSLQKKYSARLKDGYTKNDIISAVENAVKNDYHKNTDFQYLTPEFFSRANTIDKYASVTTKSNDSSEMSVISNGGFKNF